MKSASTPGALKCAHLHDLSDGLRRLPAMVVLWIMHSQLAADPTRSESGWLRDQPLKDADLSTTVKSEFFEFSCMRACCLYTYFQQN